MEYGSSYFTILWDHIMCHFYVHYNLGQIYGGVRTNEISHPLARNHPKSKKCA
jgi:hypothetical protein